MSPSDETRAPVQQGQATTVESHQDSSEAPLSHLEHRVLSPIKQRIYGPLNRFVDRLTYRRAAILFVLVTFVSSLAALVWKKPEDVRKYMTLARYGWAARHPVPSAESDVAAVKRDLLNVLKDEISPAKRNSGAQGSYGPWTQAQMAVSLEGQTRDLSADLSQWFVGQEIGCTCWREYKTSPQHVAVTAWVLLAFARMGVRPGQQEIDFVLHNQTGAGWWPIFPAADDASNASTYATALSVWALAELLQRNLIDSRQSHDVEIAIANGREWLLNNSVPGKPGRWRDYPGPGLYSEESFGISGLALHVLHHTKGAQPVANDVYWMAHLPAELPSASENSSSNHVVTTPEGPIADPTHNFSLPWLLIGTADAYGHGTWAERSHALRLFHQIPDRREAISRDINSKPWLAAELLASLRHLLHEDVI